MVKIRRDDIIPLVDHFRRHYAKRHNKTIKAISAAASHMLFEYPWRGNVRELRNTVESMVVIDTDGRLDTDDLPPGMVEQPGERTDAVEGPLSLVGRPLEEIERWAIEQTLKLTGGNREETARILGIGARTLYRRLEQYGLKD